MSKPCRWPAPMACMTSVVASVIRIGYVDNLYRRGPAEMVCCCLTWGPPQAAAADKVQMDVEYGLSGVRVGIEHRPKAACRNAALLRNRRGAPRQLADDGVV